jgi:hypothetical protein
MRDESLADYNRRIFRREPPGFSLEAKRLDEIAAADARRRQEAKAVELMEADLIAHAKQGELRPEDCESYTRRSAEDIHD